MMLEELMFWTASTESDYDKQFIYESRQREHKHAELRGTRTCANAENSVNAQKPEGEEHIMEHV